MRTSDKFLIAVVLGLLILAGVTVMLGAGESRPAYSEEKTPTDVVTNYIFAMQEGEYERAYGYLSPQLPGYPKDLQDFIRNVNTDSYAFDRDTRTSYQVSSERSGDDWAVVEIEQSSYYHDNLFLNNRWQMTFTLSLELIDGEWKISGGDHFMAYCWTRRFCP